MLKKTLAPAGACALATGAAAAQDATIEPTSTPSPAGVAAPVEAGRTFRTTDASELELSTVYFDSGGALRIQGEQLGLKIDGRRFLRDGYVCTEFKGNGRECWTLDMDAPRGSLQRLASDRGRVVKFTRL